MIQVDSVDLYRHPLTRAVVGYLSQLARVDFDVDWDCGSLARVTVDRSTRVARIDSFDLDHGLKRRQMVFVQIGKRELTRLTSERVFQRTWGLFSLEMRREEHKIRRKNGRAATPAKTLVERERTELRRMVLQTDFLSGVYNPWTA